MMTLREPGDQVSTYPAISDEIYGETARALINAANELIAVITTDGNILAVNNKFARTYAAEGNKPAGASIYDILPIDLRPGMKEMIDSIPGNGNSERRELESNGTWYEVKTYLIPGGDDPRPKIALVLRDVTDERSYKETVRDNEQKYRQIVDTANEGILVADEKLRFTLFNKQAQIMFGVTEQEALGKSLDMFIYPEDSEDHQLKIQQRIQGVADRYERRFRRINGKPLWAIVSARPIYGKHGFAGSISLITDITKWKLVEETVRESEERYRTAIEHSNDGVAIVRGEELIYVNKMFVGMFGYDTDEELIGKSQGIIVHPDERNSVAEMTRVRQAGGMDIPERYEFKGIRKDGTPIDVEVSATRTQYKGEMVSLAYLRDISARKHMENEILNMRKLESIGILAGGIAHDFNNLLMSMLGYISLAKLHLQSDDMKARDKLAEAVKTIDRARELTTQLITFSKGGSPLKKVLTLQPIIVEASRMALSGTPIACSYSFQDDLWKVLADEPQLRQVIRQLVRNSVEAMPKGGSLSISGHNIAVEAQGDIFLPSGKYVELRVKDTGKGIFKEHISQVFDPYFTTKDFGPQKGMGLGLAVCYSIVKKHGGHIDVESEPGKETTFRILLPARISEPDIVPDAAPVVKTEALYRLKILIADDEQSILQTTTMLLKHLGHDVAGTLKGTDAIDLYRRSMESGEPFDVIILDLISPGGPDGVKILNEIVKLDPGVRAILSSGYPDDPQIINYKEYGFKGVLLKPYRIEDLNSVLTAVRTASNL